MFRIVPLSIIRIFSLYTQQWYMSYRFADSLRALTKPVCIAVCTAKNSWRWTKELSETCRVLFQKQILGRIGTELVPSRLVPSWSYSQAVSKPVWQIPLLCVQWKTPEDGQRNCPKHVDFHSKNKFWVGSGQNWFRPDPIRKLSANLYDRYHCCVYSEKLLMMGRGTVRNM